MRDTYKGALTALNKVLDLFKDADPENKDKKLLILKNQIILYKNYYEELVKIDENYKKVKK